MGKIGKFAPDGSVETDATDCFVTGRFILGNHQSRIRIGTAGYFVRVGSDVAHLFNREDAEKAVTSLQAEAAPKRQGVTAEPKPPKKDAGEG